MKFFFQRRRSRGQTLVEYALIIAYISIVAIHSLQTLSNATQEQLVYTNGALVIAQTTVLPSDGLVDTPTLSALQQKQILNCFNYVYSPSTWQGVTPSYVPAAQSRVYTRLFQSITSS